MAKTHPQLFAVDEHMEEPEPVEIIEEGKFYNTLIPFDILTTIINLINTTREKIKDQCQFDSHSHLILPHYYFSLYSCKVMRIVKPFCLNLPRS